MSVFSLRNGLRAKALINSKRLSIIMKGLENAHVARACTNYHNNKILKHLPEIIVVIFEKIVMLYN